MASKRGITVAHWRRPRTRMYDYNYEYGVSYYKPQVRYIGEAMEPDMRRSRRRALSPPRAKTFSERWAANPFYGRVEPISEYYVARPAALLGRASSIPSHMDGLYAEEEAGSRHPMRSMSRARSVFREASVAPASHARSMTRGRSMSRARSVFDEEYDEGARSVRGGSYYDDEGYYFDPLSDAEWERVLKSASKEERERSIFQLRMSLENPRDLQKKKMMQTTLAHGMYQNSLYGTELWDPAPYLSGRQ